jgi:hypothetical protein
MAIRLRNLRLVGNPNSWSLPKNLEYTAVTNRKISSENRKKIVMILKVSMAIRKPKA